MFSILVRFFLAFFVLGLILWILSFLPSPEPFVQAIRTVLIIIMIVVVISLFWPLTITI